MHVTILTMVLIQTVWVVITSAVPTLGGGTNLCCGCSHITTNPSSHREQMGIGFVDAY